METRFNRCRASEEELAHDHQQSWRELTTAIANGLGPSREQKRQEVIELADRFLAGEPVRLTHWADRPYTIDDLLTEIFEHPLYDKAVFAAYSTDSKPMRDLVIRIARYATAESLFGIGAADDLGFLK